MGCWGTVRPNLVTIIITGVMLTWVEGPLQKWPDSPLNPESHPDNKLVGVHIKLLIWGTPGFIPTFPSKHQQVLSPLSRRMPCQRQAADPDDMEDLLRHVRRGVEARTRRDPFGAAHWRVLLRQVPCVQANMEVSRGVLEDYNLSFKGILSTSRCFWKEDAHVICWACMLNSARFNFMVLS